MEEERRWVAGDTTENGWDVGEKQKDAMAVYEE